MPSPFPGMNPYFEQSTIWQDFHNEFVGALRRLIAPQVVPDYFVQLEEHLYIHDLPPEQGRVVGRADVSLASTGISTRGQGGVDLLEAPAEVYLPAQDVGRVQFLEIRDRTGQELITVIELLSPSNKQGGEDREKYLAKRRELFRSRAHFVEIDLLRGGQPMPTDDRPECDYSVLISRAERRPIAEFWPIPLRDRLPVIPIPLRVGTNDARIDLQEVLDRTYDGPSYEYVLYRSPPQPALSADESEWAQNFLPKSARNRGGDPS